MSRAKVGSDKVRGLRSAARSRSSQAVNGQPSTVNARLARYPI
jgi:hypothetical protein